jgi:hypothetical protein
MNDVCDTWSSPWAALQKMLAKTVPHTSGTQGGVPGTGSWLGRARNRKQGTAARSHNRVSALK